MKLNTINIALIITVTLSSLGLQSCSKETAEVTPVEIPAANITIVGKWRAVKGTTTIEREFVKGADENHGTGNMKITSTNPGNIITTTSINYKWEVSSDRLRITELADNIFLFDLANNGNRLIIYSDKLKKVIYETSERII